MPVEHKDILEFLNIGTEGNPIQELTHGVSVTNEWMKEMIDGDMEKGILGQKFFKEEEKLDTHTSFLKTMLTMALLKYTKKIITA